MTTLKLIPFLQIIGRFIFLLSQTSPIFTKFLEKYV